MPKAVQGGQNKDVIKDKAFQKRRATLAQALLCSGHPEGFKSETVINFEQELSSVPSCKFSGRQFDVDCFGDDQTSWMYHSAALRAGYGLN